MGENEFEVYKNVHLFVRNIILCILHSDKLNKMDQLGQFSPDLSRQEIAAISIVKELADKNSYKNTVHDIINIPQLTDFCPKIFVLKLCPPFLPIDMPGPC